MMRPGGWGLYIKFVDFGRAPGLDARSNHLHRLAYKNMEGAPMAEAGFSPELKSSDIKGSADDKTTTPQITSRNKDIPWNDPILIPTSLTGFSQSVSDLKVSIIEQTAGDDSITTYYAASGKYFNHTEDDKTYEACSWTINFLNTAGTIIDTYTFYIQHAHCSRSEEPFSEPPTLSAFNFIDVIYNAKAQGTKPGGYEGGC
jgi:hypothetical protein